MKKAETATTLPTLPEQVVYIQRQDETDDGGFIYAYESAADIDFDQNDIVGEYKFVRFVRVTKTTKVRTVIQRTVIQEVK